MRPYTIEFVDTKYITTMVPMFDAFKFKPEGRAQWAQRLAWKFLNWRGAMKQAYEPKVTSSRHTIDADKFIERVIKQRVSLLHHFRKDGQRLLIGSDDYFELMGELSSHQHFKFDACVHNGRQIMGLKVEVIPWMRGAIVMP